MQIVDDLRADRARPGALDRRRLRRRRDRQAGAAGRTRPHPRRDAGRLLDLIERRDVSLARVRMLVLDEADRMLDMGFKPVVDRIVKMTAAKRQTLLFSATLEGEVGRIAKAYTTNPRRHEHAHSEERKGDVEHRFVTVTHDGKVARLVTELQRATSAVCTLVFVRTKRGADRLVKKLASQQRRRRSRCTATSPRASASARWPTSRPASSTRWSRPTSPPAASTWPASRTSSTTTSPPRARTTSTASAAPHAPARAASASRSWPATRLANSRGMVRELGLDRELELAGMRAGAASRRLAAVTPPATGAGAARSGGRHGPKGASGAARRPARAGSCAAPRALAPGARASRRGVIMRRGVS